MNVSVYLYLALFVAIGGVAMANTRSLIVDTMASSSSSSSALPPMSSCVPAAADAKVHQATGRIVSFNEGRTSVMIAHDEIPGFMMAMTMSFQAKTPGQLDGLNAKDLVAFSFTSSEGRRILERIVKTTARP